VGFCLSNDGSERLCGVGYAYGCAAVRQPALALVGGFEPRLSLAVERIIVNPTSVRGKTDMARVHIIWRQ